MTTLMHRTPDQFASIIEWLTGGAPAEALKHGSYIPVEEFTESGNYVLRADLPGIDPDKDVSVTVDNDTLTIAAERRSESHEGGRSEVRYGTFSRTLHLPSSHSNDEIAASYNDGVLEVRIPMATDASAPVRVPIARKPIDSTK